LAGIHDRQLRRGLIISTSSGISEEDAAMLFTISLVLFLLCTLVWVAVSIAGMGASFSKAGEPGWACIIPIYQVIVMCRIAGKPWWWLFLLMIPLAGIVFAVMIMIAFAQAFGRGGGFAAGLMFLPFVFWPLLGFGDAEYQGY
jgi:hypothetical protein